MMYVRSNPVNVIGEPCENPIRVSATTLFSAMRKFGFCRAMIIARKPMVVNVMVSMYGMELKTVK